MGILNAGHLEIMALYTFFLFPSHTYSNDVYSKSRA